MHGGEEPLGSLVKQHAVGQGAGVDGYGGDVGGNGGAHAQRGVLHHQTFIGTQFAAQHGATLREPHQIGLGVGFSLFDVEARDHALGDEDIGVEFVQLLEQRGGAAAGNEQQHDALGLHLADEGQGSGHGVGLRKLAEIGRLHTVHLLGHLAGGGYAFACGNNLDSAEPRASLVHVGFLLAEVEAEVGHGLMPRAGMIGHGVEKNSVHIEEDCRGEHF